MFYPTGLLGLAILPLILFHYIQKNDYLRHRTLVDVFCITDEWILENEKHFESPFLLHPKRNFTTIEITGDAPSDELKFRFGRLMIHELMVTTDTVLGVRFHFGPKAKYEHWVYALDAATLAYKPAFSKYMQRVVYQDEIRYYNYIHRDANVIGQKLKSVKFGTQTRIVYMECGYRRKKTKPKKQAWWSNFFAYRRYWPIGAGWLVLCAWSVYQWPTHQ